MCVLGVISHSPVLYYGCVNCYGYTKKLTRGETQASSIQSIKPAKRSKKTTSIIWSRYVLHNLSNFWGSEDALLLRQFVEISSPQISYLAAKITDWAKPQLSHHSAVESLDMSPLISKSRLSPSFTLSHTVNQDPGTILFYMTVNSKREWEAINITYSEVSFWYPMDRLIFVTDPALM